MIRPKWPESIWGRLTLGCLTILLLLAAFAGWVLWQIGRPYHGPVTVSPDRAWRVWLQRPNGSMEPQYYSIMVDRNQWFARDTPCAIGGVTNYFAERYTRFHWLDGRTVRFDYGIADRDTTQVGRPAAYDNKCPPVRLILRHDPALDKAASATNETNHNYAVPVPEDPLIAAMSEQMERSNAKTH